MNKNFYWQLVLFTFFASFLFFCFFSFKQKLTGLEETEHQSYYRNRQLRRKQSIYTVEEVNSMSERMRRLIGSNCITIERGNVPVYYDCEGCIVEEANYCVDDLRQNITGNIHPSCKMNSIRDVRTEFIY